MVDIARRSSRRSAKKSSKIFSWWLWLALIPVGVIALPTVLLLVVAMAPTLVAAFIDRRPEKYAAYTVGGFNLSATIPYVLKLWFAGHTMAALTKIVANPFAWLIIYGAAGLGWVAFTYTPEVVLRVTGFRDRQNVAAMVKRQEHLVEEWGNDVIPPSTSGGEELE